MVPYVTRPPSRNALSLPERYHRDDTGPEVGAVVERGGRWAGIEVRLGDTRADGAARSLLALRGAALANRAARPRSPRSRPWPWGAAPWRAGATTARRLPPSPRWPRGLPRGPLPGRGARPQAKASPSAARRGSMDLANESTSAGGQPLLAAAARHPEHAARTARTSAAASEGASPQ